MILELNGKKTRNWSDDDEIGEEDEGGENAVIEEDEWARKGPDSCLQAIHLLLFQLIFLFEQFKGSSDKIHIVIPRHQRW